MFTFGEKNIQFTKITGCDPTHLLEKVRTNRTHAVEEWRARRLNSSTIRPETPLLSAGSKSESSQLSRGGGDFA
jgi:hypothetical protein